MDTISTKIEIPLSDNGEILYDQIPKIIIEDHVRRFEAQRPGIKVQKVVVSIMPPMPYKNVPHIDIAFEY